MTTYKVKAIVNDELLEDVVCAVDPHDAVDVFEITNNCYNNGKQVSIKNVEVIE